MTLVVEDTKLTQEQLQRALPKQFRGKATPELLDKINQMMVDPQLRENFRDNLLSFTSVMTTGKYKIQSYVDAVRYVSHKLLGSSNIEAYSKTFPGRFQRLVNEGADDKTISSYSSAYNKNQLVVKISEQTLTPFYIVNADMFQKALNVQATLMVSAASEKVRTDAANSILNHLKPPETQKIELDIGLKQDKTIDDLRLATADLMRAQKAKLEQHGMTVTDLGKSSLVIEGSINGGD